MFFRPKLFLTFAALCTTPLLILSLINFRSGVKNAEAALRSNLSDELNYVADHYHSQLQDREDELRNLSNGTLAEFVRSSRTPEAIALIDSRQDAAVTGPPANIARATRRSVTKLALSGYYAQLACFDSGKKLLFLVQPVPNLSPTFRTKDFLPGVIEPDEGVWWRQSDKPRCPAISDPMFGEVMRCTVPIFLTEEEYSNPPRGAIVADIRLTEVFSGLGQGFETNNLQQTRQVIVWSSAGKIIYHQNAALRNQTIDQAMPEFAPVAAAMAARGDGGMEEFRSAEGDQWIGAFKPEYPPGLYLAVARNYSQATQSVRRSGWLGIVLSVLLGLGTATLLTAYFQKKTQHLERITESVAAIAGGNLDRIVEARSSDDLRMLADNVNMMTEHLREQLAREAEARQFESFVKLSALLTHDLKNAIEGLSLMVGNMERHFDNPRFRADAMKGLTGAADKLRALVTRLTKPINTLSGEFKMPRPTDLVPLLRRVLAQIAEPLVDTHEVETRLPPSLMAMADSERIEKVMENLVLNAVEAMAGMRGKLSVEAGPASGGKVFFTVTDSGCGISPEFIHERLFRPFATTKTHGVGLGLYTCREVVRANGGSIEVDSKEGSGTTFRVVLASAAPIKRSD